MDCRTFRRNHCAFIDDTLPGVDLVAMARHRAECSACGEYDARIRRSLLVVRNLPRIECSEDFSERLFRRLRDTEVDRTPVLTRSGPGLMTYGALAATLLLASAGGLAMLGAAGQPAQVRLQPVVASERATVTDALSNSAIMASASGGLPVWPALLLAEEIPMQVAESGFQIMRVSLAH